MRDSLQRLRRFLAELKRRKVYRVGAVYAAVAFVIVQAANLVFPALNIPSWAYSLVVVLALLGFPLALVLAWAFEVTPEGVRRTPDAERGEEATAEAEPSLSTGYRILVAFGLVAAAVAGGWYLTGGSGSEPEVTERSIAVLPFEHRGGEESGQLSLGLHDGLLTRLSNISDLEVISRTSVMQYRETDKTIPQIARELGTGWVVEGSVQQTEGQVQVNAQLIKAPEDAHQWARRYQRDLSSENLFAIQSDLTKRIARSLQAELSPEEARRVERVPTPDLEAYRAYVSGREAWWRTYEKQFGRATVDTAISHFRLALQRDTTFDAARAWLARSYAALYQTTGQPRWRDSALHLSRTVVRKRPDLAAARNALGFAHHVAFLFGEHPPDSALAQYRRALELSPSSAFTASAMALLNRQRGEFAKAVRWARRGVELAPNRPRQMFVLARALMDARYYEPAAAWCRRALEIESDYRPVLSTLAEIERRRGRPERGLKLLREHISRHGVERWGVGFDGGSVRQAGHLALAAGRFEEARGLLLRLLEEAPEADTATVAKLGPEAAAWLGYAYVRLGNRKRGQTLLREAANVQRDEVRRGGEPDALVGMARILSALGETTAARDDLRRAVEAGYDRSLASPLFEPVRAEDWFEQLSRQARPDVESVQARIDEMNLDLYPPGATSDTLRRKGGPNGR